MKGLLAFFSLATFTAIGQVNYNDVGVVINNNSQTSIDIANYFQQERNIPAQNMIYFTGPTTEEIDSLQFEQIRAQIENYLSSNNLSDSLNYLVTTKGVPLKINSGCLTDTLPGAECASFDSELALILGPYSNYIGQSGALNNPILNDTSSFSRDSSGIYLVTRLTGYTKQDAIDLIDRSGALIGVNKVSANGILDMNSQTSGDSLLYASYLQPGYDYLFNNSWNAIMDLNYPALTNQDNVFAYFEIGSFMTDLNYGWVDGAIAYVAACNSGETFDTTFNTPIQTVLADLISEGVTGAHGYVDCLFATQVNSPEILFNRYLDSVKNYNLAESFYMAEKTLSWQSVVVGDPKTSAIIDNKASINGIESMNLLVYPNPCRDVLKITSEELINSVSIYNVNGTLIRQIQDISDNMIQINITEFSDGLYLVNIVTDNRTLQKKVLVRK